MTINLSDIEEESVINPQFRFTNEQYNQFEIATIICSSISMVAATMVIGMYTYLCIRKPKDANRVSLHCVIASTVFSFVNQALNLAALRSDVNGLYCSAFRILNIYISLQSSSLLAMVGIYLVLMFYFHVQHWPCRPEYILLPIATLYTIIGNLLGFIYNDVPGGFRTIFLSTKDECWYYSNFIDRLYTKAVWIYYYVFIFFITAVSFVCSLLAMHKVYLDKVTNQKNMIQISERKSAHSFLKTPPLQSTSTTGDEETVIKRKVSLVQKSITRKLSSHSDVFSKIIFRTLLYPLTPFLVHIFGFSLQMYLINEHHIANYGLVMMDIVMARLEGTWIACIFFVDPTVLKILQGSWHKLKRLLGFREPVPSIFHRPSVIVSLPANPRLDAPTLTPISSLFLDPNSSGL